MSGFKLDPEETPFHRLLPMAFVPNPATRAKGDIEYERQNVT